MADIYSNIKEEMQKICQPKGLRVYLAQVVSVEDDTTCTIQLEEDLQISDVRLRSVVNGEDVGVLITPKKDSVVLVADLSGGDYTQMVAIAYSEIEKIDICTANTTMLIDGEKATMTIGNTSATVEDSKLQLAVGQVEIGIESDKLSIKKGGVSLFDLLDGLLQGILALTVPTGTGPSGTPINAASFTELKMKLTQIMQ